jgi:predicted nucleic acid-binding protein
MSGKVFFDTNILVYSLSYSDLRKQTHAKQLLRASVLNDGGVIS